MLTIVAYIDQYIMDRMNGSVEIFLEGVLNEIFRKKTSEFSGVGLIVYSDFSMLPVAPMVESMPIGLELPITNAKEIAEWCLRLNMKSSRYHDGFHLISSNLSLTHICCYFAPPIDNRIVPDLSHGARYRSAQYGAILACVETIGIIGVDYPPVVFKKTC